MKKVKTDAAPRPSRVAARASPASPAAPRAERLPRYAKGDGITTEKARFPSVERPGASYAKIEVPLGPSMRASTLLLAAQAEPKPKAAPAAVPAPLVPITPANARSFRAAFLKALATQEPWARSLAAEAKHKDAELNKATFLEIGQMSWPSDAAPGALDRAFAQKHAAALDRSAKAGEPWAQALLAMNAGHGIPGGTK